MNSRSDYIDVAEPFPPSGCHSVYFLPCFASSLQYHYTQYTSIPIWISATAGCLDFDEAKRTIMPRMSRRQKEMRPKYRNELLSVQQTRHTMFSHSNDEAWWELEAGGAG